jgi:hypothetical protein
VWIALSSKMTFEVTNPDYITDQAHAPARHTWPMPPSEIVPIAIDAKDDMEEAGEEAGYQIGNDDRVQAAYFTFYGSNAEGRTWNDFFDDPTNESVAGLRVWWRNSNPHNKALAHAITMQVKEKAPTKTVTRNVYDGNVKVGELTFTVQKETVMYRR